MKWLGPIIGIVVLVAAIAVPFEATSAKTLLLVAIAQGLAVTGIVILLQAGQVSFGHALYFAAGAYTAAFVWRATGGGELISMLVCGALVGAVMGLVVGMFVVRYRYIFFSMLNLAFSMVFYSFLVKFFNLTGGSDGIRVARPSVLGFVLGRGPFEPAVYYIALALAVAVFIGVLAYLRSPLGQALRAIRTNETRLEYLGISARSVLLRGYILSAMLCGLAGSLIAAFQGLASPEYAFWTRSGEFVFIAILGGAAHVGGAFLGAVVFEAIRTYAAVLFADAWELVLGIVLIVIVLFAPEGLWGLGARIGRRPRPADVPSVASTAKAVS
jgi:branched-chain amino acid transport system permease protein